MPRPILRSRAVPLDEYATWVKVILRPLMEHKDPRALETLHATLRPILLRRTKDTKRPDGSPIIQLPVRKEYSAPSP